MDTRKLTEEMIVEYCEWLQIEEKEAATIEKYVRDVRTFYRFVGNQSVGKSVAIAYKQYLIQEGYAISSINSMLVAMNGLFSHMGWADCRVRTMKKQRQIYYPAGKELMRGEYLKLVETAQREGNQRLMLILQTLCATGIRVSELQYITVEAVLQGEAVVSCKGKIRVVFIVSQLQEKLLEYAKQQAIAEGAIFVTRSGKPINRINIWREMKNISHKAGINPEKVTPHSLRHLFARAFYSANKDIVKLADVLGHSSVNTTRIYVISTGDEHRQCMEELQLVL